MHSKKFVLRLGLLLVDLGLLVRVDCRLVLVGQRVLLPARPILCCPIVRGVGAFPAYLRRRVLALPLRLTAAYLAADPPWGWEAKTGY